MKAVRSGAKRARTSAGEGELSVEVKADVAIAAVQPRVRQKSAHVLFVPASLPAELVGSNVAIAMFFPKAVVFRNLMEAARDIALELPMVFSASGMRASVSNESHCWKSDEERVGVVALDIELPSSGLPLYTYKVNEPELHVILNTETVLQQIRSSGGSTVGTLLLIVRAQTLHTKISILQPENAPDGSLCQCTESTINQLESLPSEEFEPGDEVYSRSTDIHAAPTDKICCSISCATQVWVRNVRDLKMGVVATVCITDPLSAGSAPSMLMSTFGEAGEKNIRMALSTYNPENVHFDANGAPQSYYFSCKGLQIVSRSITSIAVGARCSLIVNEPKFPMLSLHYPLGDGGGLRYTIVGSNTNASAVAIED